LTFRGQTWVLLALAACAPQVVDAVDEPGSGGLPVGAGGGSTSAGTNGSGGNETSTGGGHAEGGAAGATGCNALGTAGLDATTCEVLLGSLAHRYTFDGAGTVVMDAWGGPSGRVVNSTLTGDGAVALAGHMSDQYVDLPNGLLSALGSATLEAWLTWAGGNEWQRVFDFGDDQSGVEGQQSSGETYLFLTPRITDAGDALMRVAYRRGPAYAETHVDATRTLPAGRLTHVAVTFDAASALLAVYIDGTLENAKTSDVTPIDLGAINDINNWLGRSQYGADADLGASIEEFRIYATALTAAEVHASFDAGPNPTFLDPASQ
jgi:hypothetical protein